jgi:hypothetical protein
VLLSAAGKEFIGIAVMACSSCAWAECIGTDGSIIDEAVE